MGREMEETEVQTQREGRSMSGNKNLLKRMLKTTQKKTVSEKQRGAQFTRFFPMYSENNTKLIPKPHFKGNDIDLVIQT